MRVLFVWPNKDSFGFKPIGLSLLSAVAKEAGWEAGLFDTTGVDFGYMDNTISGQSAKIFKPVDLSAYNLVKEKIDLRAVFEKKLKEFDPDCLAFTVLSDEYLIAAEISKIAKETLPSVPVIWGGKYPTLKPEKALREYYADFACIGEGLDAFREFLLSLHSGKSSGNIPNIWAKAGSEIIRNRIRPLRTAIDDLPFADWGIFDKRHFIKPFDGKAYVGGDHMLNWGCPYHCTYCINHYYHKLYDNKYLMRRYSVKRIIEELKYLKTKHKLEFFKFHDEDFLMRPVDNLRELSRAYKAEINIPFVIETNPKSVIEEKVKLLKDMDCVSASIAIESGDLEVRNKILRRVDSEEDILRAFSLFKDAGIRTSSFNLLGIPFETRQTYFRTVELNKKADVQYPSIGFFFPFEGTELRRISVANGYFDEQRQAVYKHDRPALRFKDLSEEELIQMRSSFVLYVKLPKIFWPFVARAEQLDETGVSLRRKILDIYEDTVWVNNGWYKSDDTTEKRHLAEMDAILRKG